MGLTYVAYMHQNGIFWWTESLTHLQLYFGFGNEINQYTSESKIFETLCNSMPTQIKKSSKQFW